MAVGPCRRSRSPRAFSARAAPPVAEESAAALRRASPGAPRPAAAAGATEPILLGIRLCPAGARHAGERQVLEVCAGGRGVKVRDPAPSGGTKAEELLVDAVMDSRDPQSPDYIGQAGVYDRFGRPMVDHIFQGESTALFAYGQSGTGKTTTIVGEAEPSGRGLLPRALEDIFERATQRSPRGAVRVHMQMLEIYNEKIRDLLPAPAPAFVATPQGGGEETSNRAPAVHAHPRQGVYVTGAEEPLVGSLGEATALLNRGLSARSIAATALNRKSSRAHTVIKLRVEQTWLEGPNASDGNGNASSDVTAELFFVDLAGRENEKTSQVTGERRKELISINRSLFHLSSCIKSLGVGTQTPPAFRNSCLTLLLRNALTGRSRTAMIGTLHPAATHYEETLNTLRFAAIVKGIKLLRTAPAAGAGAKWPGAAARARSGKVAAESGDAAQRQEELQRKREELSAMEQKLKEQERLREEQLAAEARAAENCERLAAAALEQARELERQREELRALEIKREEVAAEKRKEEQRLREERKAGEARAAAERARQAAEASARQAEVERQREELRALEAQVESAAKKSLEEGRRLREQQQAEIAQAVEERTRLAAEASAKKAELERQSEETRRLEAERKKALKDMLDEEQRLREEQQVLLTRAAEERTRLAVEAQAEQEELSRQRERLRALEADRAEEQRVLEQQKLEERAVLSAERAEVDRKLEELRTLEAKREEAASNKEKDRQRQRAVRACVRAKKKLEEEMRKEKERMINRQAYMNSPSVVTCSPAAMSPLELLIARETLIQTAARGGRAETACFSAGGTTTTIGPCSLTAPSTHGWVTERATSTASCRSGGIAALGAYGDQTARLGEGLLSIPEDIAKSTFISKFQYFPEPRELPVVTLGASLSQRGPIEPLVKEPATCGGA